MVLATPFQGSFGPERSAEDVLAGRLRIKLAGTWYTLPVLTIGENADWLAGLEASFTPLVEANEDDLEAVVTALSAVDDRLLEFVYLYDKRGLLPPREEIERDIYPHEVLRAVMEVRLAANPTVAYGLALALAEMRAPTPEPAPSAPTSSPRRRGAGRTRTSGAN